MASDPTYKEVELARARLTLLRNAGTPAQRAIRVVDGRRPSQLKLALQKAVEEFPGQPLAWLKQIDGTITAVE
jgi:hypothetical protein